MQPRGYYGYRRETAWRKRYPWWSQVGHSPPFFFGLLRFIFAVFCVFCLVGSEATKDTTLAFSGHMIMWKSPNTYDVLYKIKWVQLGIENSSVWSLSSLLQTTFCTCRYDKSVSLTGVTGNYDAGATVRFMDTNKKVLASKSCYDSNGGKRNKCTLSFSKTTGTTFYLQIDSHHSTWNWMGEWKIDGDTCASGSDLYRFSDTSSCKPTITIEQDGTQVCDVVIILTGFRAEVATISTILLSRSFLSCHTIFAFLVARF